MNWLKKVDAKGEKLRQEYLRLIASQNKKEVAMQVTINSVPSDIKSATLSIGSGAVVGTGIGYLLDSISCGICSGLFAFLSMNQLYNNDGEVNELINKMKSQKVENIPVKTTQ